MFFSAHFTGWSFHLGLTWLQRKSQRFDKKKKKKEIKKKRLNPREGRYDKTNSQLPLTCPQLWKPCSMAACFPSSIQIYKVELNKGAENDISAGSWARKIAVPASLSGKTINIKCLRSRTKVQCTQCVNYVGSKVFHFRTTSFTEGKKEDSKRYGNFEKC